MRTTIQCAKCAENYIRFSLGSFHGCKLCETCGQSAGVYVMPEIPPCPGTENSLERNPDGSLYWKGHPLLEAKGTEGTAGDQSEPRQRIAELENRVQTLEATVKTIEYALLDRGII